MGTFVIAEFIRGKLVSVVRKSWIVIVEESTFCYWPKSGYSARLRRGDLPDSQNWKLHEIAVLKETDNYEKALRYAKKAEDFTNPDTDSTGSNEHLAKRPRKRPARFLDLSDDSQSEEDDSVVPSPSCSEVEDLPMSTPPSVSKTCSYSSKRPADTQSTVSKKRSYSSKRPADTQSTVSKKRSYSSKRPADTQSTVSKITNTDQRPASCSEVEDLELQMPTPPSVSQIRSYSGKRPADTQSNFQREVLMKLSSIMETQKLHGTLLRELLGRGSADYTDAKFDDFHQMKTMEEINQMNKDLEDDSFTKSLIQYLRTIGGSTAGASIRLMIRRLGTNELWGNFSMNGQKANKASFKNTKLCNTLIKVCMKNHKVDFRTAEGLIAVVVKAAPHQKGGAKFVNTKSAVHTNVQLELDSSDEESS